MVIYTGIFFECVIKCCAAAVYKTDKFIMQLWKYRVWEKGKRRKEKGVFREEEVEEG